jgi:hypothetical protein
MGLDPHLYLYDTRNGLPVDQEHAHQNLGNPHLGSYLYQHSRWIEDLFCFMVDLTGGLVDEDRSQGEGQDEIFGRAELEQFLKELKNVPRPSNDNAFLTWNYDHLVLLVTAALSNPYLTLTRAVF